jgi:hypothetical protein
MVKVKIEGAGANLISALITKALRDAGVKVNLWYDVTPGEVASCRRDATKCGDDVSVVSMTR